MTYNKESSDNDDQGIYVIELTGVYADGTTVTTTFNLDLVPCVITLVPLIDQTHEIYSGQTDYAFTPFTISGTHCPDPTYTATDTTNTQPLPLSWLTFDDTTHTFSADS